MNATNKFAMFLFNVLFLVLSLTVNAQITTTRSESAARLLVDSIHAKLMNGEDFAILVGRYSEDPGTNQKGGKYSGCKVGTFTPEFEDMVLQLKEKEISQPFKSPYGFHIAQLLKRTPSSFTVRHILITYTH